MVHLFREESCTCLGFSVEWRTELPVSACYRDEAVSSMWLRVRTEEKWGVVGWLVKIYCMFYLQPHFPTVHVSFKFESIKTYD